MDISISGAFSTDSGMLALWDTQSFQSITDYDTWEPELLEDEDIQRHIASGAFVPINIGSDGAFGYGVRASVDEAPVLTSRERQYLVVTSQPYRLRSQGEAGITGIEHIEREPSASVGRLVLPAGDYAVTIHLLGWDEEPGARGADGLPTADALPDFLVLIAPATDAHTEFRTRVETFDPPSA